MDSELLQMLKVTTTDSHAGSQTLTQHLHSHLIGRCNLSHIERSVKLQNVFFSEKYGVFIVRITTMTTTFRRRQ